MAKIKVTNAFLDLVAQGMLNPILDKDLPAIVSHMVSVAIGKLEVEMGALNKTKQTLQEKYAQKDEDGNIKTTKSNRVVFEDGGQEKYTDELQDIFNIEIVLEMEMLKVQASDLPSLSIRHITLLKTFIEVV